MKKLSIVTMFMAALAAAQTPAALPRVADLKYPALRQVKIPDITTFTLPNGMRVYLLENHELPVVSGNATVRTGNLFDPADKVGLAGITGTVIRTGGTKTRTGEQIDQTLENMAASVESSIGETSGTVSFNALKENTDQVLEIFRDVLTSPEFRQDKLELAKTQTKSGISRRNDDPDGISDREFASIVYGRKNAYGWDMTYETVDAIQRADLQAFYNRHFFPSNVMLAVYGDFNATEFRAKLEKLFAGWTVKQPPVPPFPAVTAPSDAPGVYLATKTDVTQTFFNLGHQGGMLKDKDYPALSVMSDILGGGFSSRLFTQVRTRKGLAYNVGGGWGANYGHPGLFRVGGSTKSPSTVDALQSVREEMDKMRTTEVTDQELDTAKQSVLNSFVFFFDHPRKVLNRYVTYEYWGYPKDFIFQYQKAVQAVTKADVLRVAKEHLSPEKMTIVAVGNPKDFGKPLTGIGAVKELNIELPDAKKQTSQADPASLARGAKLFARAQEAMGGAAKFAAVKDATMTVDLTITAPQGAGMKVKQTSQWVAPTTMRQTQELPFGKIVVVYDGKEGWLSSPQGTMPMPPPVREQIQGELFRLAFPLWGGTTDAKVNAVGENEIELTGAGNQSVRVELDPATGLPSRTSYQSVAMQGGPQQVTAILSDYREMNGLKMPYKITIQQAGQPFADAVVSEVKLNSGLSAEEIGKKP